MYVQLTRYVSHGAVHTRPNLDHSCKLISHHLSPVMYSHFHFQRQPSSLGPGISHLQDYSANSSSQLHLG